MKQKCADGCTRWTFSPLCRVAGAGTHDKSLRPRARECGAPAGVPCTLNRERLRSDPTSVLTDRSGGVFTNHIPPTPPFAFRGLRTADTHHSAHHRTNEPHPATVTPASVIGGTRQTHNSAPLVPPTPHTPHALACSPPPGVLSLASCVRIRRAANAKPLSYSEHSRSRSAADRIPPPRPPACHMMNVPKNVPRPSTFTHGQHDARGCRATP